MAAQLYDISPPLESTAHPTVARVDNAVLFGTGDGVTELLLLVAVSAALVFVSVVLIEVPFDPL